MTTARLTSFLSPRYACAVSFILISTMLLISSAEKLFLSPL